MDWQAGSLSVDERKYLRRLRAIYGEHGGLCIEIGTLIGLTAIALDVATGPVWAVDNFTWNPWGLSAASHEALCRLVLSGRPEITLIKSSKNDFYARDWKQYRPSMVFLDCVHTYAETLRDIEWAKSVVKEGGLIMGHDYCDMFPGVIAAVKQHGGYSVHGSIWSL